MKSHSLFIVLLLLSSSAFSAQSLKNDEIKRPGLIETRQNKAREIMKDNFKTVDQSKAKKTKKANFGFHKSKEETTEKL